MREMFLQMLKKIQERLKEKGIKSQLRLALCRVKEPTLPPTPSFQGTASIKSWHSTELLRLLENKHYITRHLKPSYQKGISGRNGTCLYAQVSGMSFKIFFNNKSEREILTENGFGWDSESENENGIYISHITNTNGIAQRSYNIMTVASWGDDTVANPNWDPEIVINKTVDIIIKAKEWTDFCKANTEKFFSYTPNRGKRRKNVGQGI
jgi:hypothetical protein